VDAPSLSEGEVARLRDDLGAAGYTADGVLEALGPGAYAALARGETVPALRATTGGSPLETLVRLFVLQAGVPVADLRRAVGDVDTLAAHGVLRALDGDRFSAAVDIRPYAVDDADFLVASDLGTGIGGTHGPLRADHVLGIGGASTTLAQVTVRRPAARALDLGTGCGVQALHLAQHSDEVVATDTNPRALAMAALTAGLNELSLDLRRGSLFEPVAGERFDLVVSNPPFVVSPDRRFEYRDAGFEADDLCRVLVRQAAEHLADGGTCQVLANWLHVRGQDWRERVAEWLEPAGCDALVLQREVLDPMQYVETWLRDGGDDPATPVYARAYDAWLDWFDARGVEAVGMGWVSLRAQRTGVPRTQLEDLRHPVVQPVGADIGAWFDQVERLRGLDDAALLATSVRLAPGVRVDTESVAVPGGGLEPGPPRVRRATGLCRSGGIDPLGVSVLAGADGERPLAQVLEEVAGEHGLDAADLVPAAVAAVRTLLEEGFLLLPEPGHGEPSTSVR
jgi:methylase of polypeptide subunit release factors